MILEIDPTVPITSDTSAVLDFRPQEGEFTVTVEHCLESKFSLMVGQKNGNCFVVVGFTEVLNGV